MIELNLQMFGGRGGGSGADGGGGGNGNMTGGTNNMPSHQDIEDMFDLLQSVDMGYQANDMISTWRSLYEKIRSGQAFHPNNEEARIINGLIINYGLEGTNTISYNQTLDINTVTIRDSSMASMYFRDFANETFNTGEFTYTDTARQIASEEKQNKQRTSRNKR